MPTAESAEVVVFDDHDARIEVEHRTLVDVAEGDTPAFDEAFDAATVGDVRTLLVPEAGALYAMPALADQAREELRRLRRSVEAVPVEALRPPSDRLDALSRGEPDAWRPILDAVGDHRLMKQAPDCFVEALLSRYDIDEWEDIVLRAAESRGRSLQEQTARFVMRWLEADYSRQAKSSAERLGDDDLAACVRSVIAKRSNLSQDAITEDTPSSACADLDRAVDDLRIELGWNIALTGEETTVGDLIQKLRASQLLAKIFG